MAVAAVESGGMSYIDLTAFEHTPLILEPFPYLIVPGFLRLDGRAAVASDFPRIDQPGSFPLGDLSYGPAFAALIRELEGEKVRRAFAEKFAIDLYGRPTMITVRGQARPGDGTIHADSATKLITVLLYMNEAWEFGGRAAPPAAPAGRFGEHGGRGSTQRRNAARLPRHGQFLARPQAGRRRAPGGAAQLGHERARGAARAAPPWRLGAAQAPVRLKRFFNNF